MLCCSPVKKTVVFTRLAEGLGDLTDTPATGSTNVVHPSYNGKLVSIMHFAEVATQDHCESYIKKFASPGQRGSECVCACGC